MQISDDRCADILDQRDLRRLPGNSGNRIRKALGRGTHELTMRRHTHGQRHRALGATRLAGFDGAFNGGRIAGDHNLPGRVEVHCTDDFSLRRLGTGRQHVGIFQPQNRRHSTQTSRHRLLHQLATELDQFHRFGERQTARGDQRGILPKTVPGNEGGTCAALGQPQTPQRHRCSQDGRLGLIGLIQLFFRTLLDQRPDVIAKCRRGFGERVDDEALLDAQLGEHAERLRTLTRKDESE